MQELLALYSSGMMNAAAPDGAPPRRINSYSKTPLPAVLRRGPEAGVLRIGRFSWFGCELPFMPVSTKPFFPVFLNYYQESVRRYLSDHNLQVFLRTSPEPAMVTCLSLSPLH
jgi:hypothetical protein